MRGCEVARLRGYEVLRLRGCDVARLRGCKVERLKVFKVARLQGFEVAMLLNNTTSKQLYCDLIKISLVSYDLLDLYFNCSVSLWVR